MRGGDPRDTDRPIHVGDKPKSRAWVNSRQMALVVFMRAIAALWLLQGLGHWVRVLAPGLPLFVTLPMSAAYLVIIFAVTDLIAAIGLWLLAPWGGVLWLLAAATQIFVAVAIPNFFPGGRAVAAVDAVLIAAYFVLTWLAARDPGRR